MRNIAKHHVEKYPESELHAEQLAKCEKLLVDCDEKIKSITKYKEKKL